MSEKPTYEELEKRVLDLEKSELKLKKVEELLKDEIFWRCILVKESRDGIVVLKQNCEVYEANKRFADMLGYSMEEIQQLHVWDWDSKFTKEQILELAQTVDEVGHHFETRHRRKDGSLIDVELSNSGTTYRGQKLIFCVCRDITERKQIEDTLVKKEMKYRGIFDESIAAIYVFDTERNFIDSNQAGLDLLGYSREELLNMSMPDVDADPIVILPAQKQLLGGERIINYEHQLKRKDGRILTVLNNSRPLTDAQGNIVGMQSTLVDISERKYAEGQVKASLKEKEILLREIHHRVKNNLAIISSLLSMQANIVDDQIVYSVLQESQSRVQAMALLHETLYQSESIASLDLERYVKDLIGNIITAFDGTTSRVKFEIEVRDVKLEINQAIPCGLIINELVTNSLKHAFANGQNGMMRITAGYTKESEVALTVSDNGTGFSEDLSWKKSKSLGFRLISLMVDQLHGNMIIRNNPGAEIAIKWPVQVV
jgi:PAS domain S-box-containing protein